MAAAAAANALFNSLTDRPTLLTFPTGGTPEVTRQFAEYRSQVEQCEWKADVQGKTPLWGWAANLDEYKLQMMPTPQRLRCDIGKWTVRQLGPFTSRGGEDWHEIFAGDIWDIERTGVVPAASALFASTVSDADLTTPGGQFVGYPIVHSHHSHIYPDPKYIDTYSYKSSALVNHADSACTPADGGEKCFLLYLPDGLSMQLNIPHHFFGMYNDQRPVNSPPRRWWVQVAMRVEPTNAGSRILGWREDTRKNDLYPFVMFTIPRYSQSVMWTTAHSPIEGRVVYHLIHTHLSTGWEEAWYIQGHANQLPKEIFPHDGRVCTGVWTPPANQTNDDMKVKIMQAMKARGMSFWCVNKHPDWSKWDPFGQNETSGYSMGNGVSIADDPIAKPGAAPMGDRHGTLRCFSDTLYKGQPITYVAFYDPRPQAGHTWTWGEESMGMHFHWTSYVDTGTVQDFKMHIQPDWFRLEDPDEFNQGAKCRAMGDYYAGLRPELKRGETLGENSFERWPTGSLALDEAEFGYIMGGIVPHPVIPDQIAAYTTNSSQTLASLLADRVPSDSPGGWRPVGVAPSRLVAKSPAASQPSSFESSSGSGPSLVPLAVFAVAAASVAVARAVVVSRRAGEML